MTSTHLLEMRNVQVKLGNTEVFSDLSVTLPSDRSSAIIGPNGSGKSTLLKLIFQRISPVAKKDSIFKILGRPASENIQSHVRMSLVSHELQTQIIRESSVLQAVVSAFFSTLTTYAHQSYTDEQYDVAQKYLDFVGIGRQSDKLFSELSTGEQRRCILARALVHDPEFLILDEPTSALDLKATHQYMEVMAMLVAQGKKIVLVTHHLNEIFPQIDWFVFLKEGQVMDEGIRSSLLTDIKISKLFDIPVDIEQHDGFISAKALTTRKLRGLKGAQNLNL